MILGVRTPIPDLSLTVVENKLVRELGRCWWSKPHVRVTCKWWTISISPVWAAKAINVWSLAASVWVRLPLGRDREKRTIRSHCRLRRTSKISRIYQDPVTHVGLLIDMGAAFLQLRVEDGNEKNRCCIRISIIWSWCHEARNWNLKGDHGAFSTSEALHKYSRSWNRPTWELGSNLTKSRHHL